jgi:hypothetical protein
LTTSGAIVAAIPFLEIFEDNVPRHRPGRHVEREQVRIERHHEEFVAQQAEAAVDRPAAGPHARRDVAAVAPDLAPRARVDRPRVVVDAGHVQDAVQDERRRLEFARHVGLERPLRHQAVHVGRRNLRERTVAAAAVIARKHHPPRGIREAREQIRGGHGRARLPLRDRHRDGHHHADRNAAHAPPDPSVHYRPPDGRDAFGPRRLPR